MRVYVALLEKISALCGGCFEKCKAPVENRELWITLGRFDAMHTYELDLHERNLFQAIHENNKQISYLQSDERYFHPLYLIASDNTAPFWIDMPPFLAVTKLHFVESVNANQAYSDLLSDLEQHAKKYGCAFRAFRTIELSDMILAVTSDRLDALLNFTLTLRIFSCVGKVYTYAGINYRMAKNLAWVPSNEDKIEFFSMRFSVTDFHLAMSQIAQIRKTLGGDPAYSVSGVDDIVINWAGLETSKLVDLYRICFLNTKAFSWDHCFAEVTSRIGISLERITLNDSEEYGIATGSPSALQMHCSKLLQRCSKIQKSIHGQMRNYNWIVPLFSLANTLVRISRTAILDEFVYIMYAGVDAFLKNVEYRLQWLDDEDIVQYQAFVENWEHLMEHIIRIEGQLTQNPELRPILYDIPVAMLEYTLSFLDKVSEILQAEDGPNKAEICFLLVPRLCDRIEAQELFPASANQRPGLVLVTIPLQSLCDVQLIQRELCHEVSHFVGEKYRNRADRKNKYIQSSAALMTRVFFNSMHPALIETVQDALVIGMNNTVMLSIACMEEVVLKWVGRLIDDQTFYFRFMRKALQKSKSSCPLKLDLESTVLSNTKLLNFSELLEDLSILYREIYADICMLHLLSDRENEYVKSLIRELHSEKQLENRRYEQFAIRAYISLIASNRNIPWEIIKKKDMNLYQEIRKIDDCMKADQDPEDRLIPITSIFFLLQYSKGCYQCLCQQPQAKLLQIRKMYNNAISSSLNYEQFLENIDLYRKKLLNSNS